MVEGLLLIMQQSVEWSFNTILPMNNVWTPKRNALDYDKTKLLAEK
jgi:hypothetical protein